VPGGTVLTQQGIDAVSFCAVMAGAACESYIEDRSQQLADSAKMKFLTTSFFGRVGKHLCVFPFVEAKEIADIRKMVAVYGAKGFDIYVSASFLASSHGDIEKLLHIGYQKFKNQVKSNHGFGLKYQFRLLSAIGADLTSLDPTFSSRIAQLMDLRGEAAHNAVVAATTVPSSADMGVWVDDLVAGFKSLDGLLTKLEKKVR
jgi:hypothetical protein